MARTAKQQRIIDARNELAAIRYALHVDIMFCLDAIEHIHTDREEIIQFWHKSLVKAVFSWVEGIMFQMRQNTLGFNRIIRSLPNEALSLLEEKSYKVDAKGAIIADNYRMPFLNNFLFTLRTYAFIHGVEFQVNTGDHHWGLLKTCVDIRHRITHPKHSSDLIVNTKELDGIIEIEQWLTKIFDDIDARIHESLQEHVDASKRSAMRVRGKYQWSRVKNQSKLDR